MRQLKMLWLCLIAAAAVASVTASAAAAAKFSPEWGKCKHVEGESGGKYTDPGCTVVAKHKKVGEETVYDGEYEWTPASERVEGVEGRGSHFGVRLAGTGTFTISTAKGYTIQCSSVEEEGNEWSFVLPGSSDNAAPFLKITGCRSEGQPCETQEEEIISTGPEWRSEEGAENIGWLARYGFIESGSHPIVGIAYSDVKPGERLFPPIFCGGPISTVLLGGEHKGQNNSLMGVISPVNTMSRYSTVSFTQYGPGEQVDTLKGVKTHPLELDVHGVWEPASVSGVFEVEHEGVHELKATK